MEEKKRLLVNLAAQLSSFIVGFVISFFLTPFVIKKLGADVYGYIGLANNFVSYTSLISVALNSMATRFITISYHKGNLILAKKYYSSVYYSNIFLAIIILCVAFLVVFYLDNLIKIDIQQQWEVKLLFGLTFLNSAISLMFNIYFVPLFIKNRTDISSILNIMSNILRIIFVVVPFSLFKPHLWYYSISALISTLFIGLCNKKIAVKIFPDFKNNKNLYEFKLVKKILLSGWWNLLNKLSDILSTGMDLLLANVFISTLAMGTLSISKTIPTIILSLCASVAIIFAPKLTEYYAKDKILDLQNEIHKNIRIMGIISILPILVFIILGEDFFQLWLPNQDHQKLYQLSCISLFSLMIAMPQESLWNIFTITDKIKISSLSLLFFSILIFITIFISVNFLKDDYDKLLAIVISRLVWGGLRSLTFLPIYGAKCLKLKWNTFYPIICKNLAISLCLLILFLIIKYYFIKIDGWGTLTFYSIIISIIVLLIMSLVMLTNNQKKQFKSIIRNLIIKFK